MCTTPRSTNDNGDNGGKLFLKFGAEKREETLHPVFLADGFLFPAFIYLFIPSVSSGGLLDNTLLWESGDEKKGLKSG